MSRDVNQPASPSRGIASQFRNFVRRTACVGLVSALMLGMIVFINNMFAGMPAGMMLIVLQASGIGGLSGLVASVAFSAFRRLNRFGAVLSGFVTIACYMSCFSILFKGRVDTSVFFWVCNVIYGVAVGLIIFWPVQQLSLRGREPQQPVQEVAADDAEKRS